MRIGQRCIAAVVALAATAVLSACEQSEAADTGARPSACELSQPMPASKLECSEGDVHHAYSALYDALHSDEPEVAATAVMVALTPTSGQFPVSEDVAVAVYNGTGCTDHMIDLITADLNKRYVTSGEFEAFFAYLGEAASHLTGAKLFEALPEGAKAVTSEALSQAVEMLGAELLRAATSVANSINNGVLGLLFGALHGECDDRVSARADATLALEPYVVNSAAGYPAGPSIWLDGAVALSDFAADPSGNTWTVYDHDLEPVDLSPVNEPALSYAIAGGALVQGGDEDNTLGWHAVQDGRLTFSIPFSIYSQPVIGYRYAVVPQDGAQCGGTVWDLRAGEPTDVVLGADRCIDVISDHYGLLREESHGMPRYAVDLLTGEVVGTPEIRSIEGPLTYDYDGTAWTVPDVPDSVAAVGYGRVVYLTGGDVVTLDSRDGAELHRWSLSQVLQRQNCLLLGTLAEDRVLFTCSDNPRSNVVAETVVVGYRPAAPDAWVEGGTA